MLQKIDHIRWMFILCGLCFFSSQAQNVIRMPYSIYGIGMTNRSSNGILDAMGSTSYAMQDPYYINFRNPASYAAFDSLSFVADVAASIYTAKLSQNNMIQKNTYAKANYLSIGMPVTRHWRTSLGILPFSSVGYNISSSSTIENIGKVSYTYSGSGGINQLYWGNAFKICKGLSIGLNASYMFGSLYYNSNTEFDGSNYDNSYVTDIFTINGLYLTGGLQYFFNIGDHHRIGLGVVYSNTAYIWAKEKLLVNSYSGIYVSTNTYDTVLNNDEINSSLVIPPSAGGGFSYTYKNKLTIAADFTWENWEKYKFTKNEDYLKKAMTASIGFQFIPNPLSNNFFQRMSIRAGGKYSTGNLILHNKPITEFSVCIGAGVPLTTFNTHSSLNILFEYGKTGTTTNDLIRQDYFRFSFCFTLQERWYQRFKID